MKGPMSLRPPVAPLLVALALVAGVASAQRRRHEPPPPPIEMESAVVTWSLFVSAYGDAPARRTAIDTPPTGSIPVPLSDWSCSYGAATRTRLNDTAWSELRTVECTHGTDIVATSGACQVLGASWSARAATLSLGTTGSSRRVHISLDCEVL